MFKKLFPVFILLVAIYLINFLLYDNIYSAYNQIHLDKLMHLAGGMAIAWLAIVFFAARLNYLPSFDRFLILLGMVALVGVLWEFAEYLGQFIPTISHYLSGGDLADTLGDLAADLSGGAIVILHLLWRRKAQ